MRPMTKGAFRVAVVFSALALNACGGSLKTEAPAEEPAAEAPADEPAAEAPADEPAAEAPAEVSALDDPITNLNSLDSDLLGLDNEEFLLLMRLTIQEEYDYCYTYCKRASPDEWISRAGGGKIDNNEIVDFVVFLLDDGDALIDSYCDLFWKLGDGAVYEFANAIEVNPKAAIVGSYAVCDS